MSEEHSAFHKIDLLLRPLLFRSTWSHFVTAVRGFSHKSMDSSYCSFTGYWWNGTSEVRWFLFSGPLWTCGTPTFGWRSKVGHCNMKLCEDSESEQLDVLNLESNWIFSLIHLEQLRFATWLIFHWFVDRSVCHFGIDSCLVRFWVVVFF